MKNINTYICIVLLLLALINVLNPLLNINKKNDRDYFIMISLSVSAIVLYIEYKIMKKHFNWDVYVCYLIFIGTFIFNAQEASVEPFKNNKTNKNNKNKKEKFDINEDEFEEVEEVNEINKYDNEEDEAEDEEATNDKENKKSNKNETEEEVEEVEDIEEVEDVEEEVEEVEETEETEKTINTKLSAKELDKKIQKAFLKDTKKPKKAKKTKEAYENAINVKEQVVQHLNGNNKNKLVLNEIKQTEKSELDAYIKTSIYVPFERLNNIQNNLIKNIPHNDQELLDMNEYYYFIGDKLNKVD